MYTNKNKLPNFFKTQWIRLLFGLIFFILAIVRLVTLPELEADLEGYIDGLFGVSCNLMTGLFWFVAALTEHNSECVKALEKRVIQLEDRSITDIEEVEPNLFVAKRYCGPDKEVKPQPPKSGSKIEKPKNTITVIVTKDGKTTTTEVSVDDADFNKIVKKVLD